MMIAAGAALLVLPALYAGLMSWLRGGWQYNFTPPAPCRAQPLSKKEGGANAVSWHEELELKLESSSPSFLERGLGAVPGRGEVVHEHELQFSVLIAARNEAENLPQLLRDLAVQTLPAACFEVLIADDHSTDATAAIVAATAKKTRFVLRLITLPAAATGKKAALLAAQQAARAPWLVCTDADCRLGPGWLTAYAALLARQPETNFISGPVLLTGPAGLFTTLMGLELAGLVGVGAACLARQQPTMCNGANLAYRRTAFAAVGGFTAHAHLASGDDEFLLHAIHARFPGTTRFLFDATAVVRTAAPDTLRALLRQRVRWASKWAHYRSPAPQRLALLVLGANVALAAGVAAALAWPGLWPWVAGAAVLKLGGDVCFLGPVLRFFGRRVWLWGLLPLQILYAPYALAVGLAGWRGGYEWKGRAVR